MQPYVMIRHVHKSKTPFADLVSQSFAAYTWDRIRTMLSSDHVVAPVLYAPHVTQLWLKKLYAD